MQIFLATCSKLPDLDADERPLIDVLAAKGLSARAVVWDDPSVNWSEADLCLVRCTWDYHERFDAYVAWTRRVASESRLLNSAELIAWNADKSYLKALSDEGLPVVPTRWVERGGACDLGETMAVEGWPEAVLKPTVSAAATNTLRFSPKNLDRAQAMIEALLTSKSVMIQPYLTSVETYGERSLIFIDGALSHAIRRNPALTGEPIDHFRVVEVTPPSDEVQLARRILAALPEQPLYARVDLVRDDAGGLMLLELELIEPSLFMGFTADAYEAFATAIARRCASLSVPC